MTGAMFRFCGTVIAVPLAAWLLPGVYAASGQIAWIAGVLLGLMFLILRPIAKLLLTPFNCLTFGLIGFLLDIGFVQLTARWMHGFAIESFWWAIVVALVVTVLRESLGRLAR